MTRDGILPDPDDFPSFMIVAGTKAVTIKSPTDGDDGLVMCWTKAAAEKVARRTPAAVVVEATTEMLVEAMEGEAGDYEVANLEDWIRRLRTEIDKAAQRKAEEPTTEELQLVSSTLPGLVAGRRRWPNTSKTINNTKDKRGKADERRS